MTDTSTWQSASMLAMRPHVDDARDERVLWQLPDWDAYSESCASERSSQALDASAIGGGSSNRPSDAALADSSLSWTGDDADDSDSSGGDSDDSDANALARRMPQRSPVSTRTSPSTPKRQSVLQQLHQRYAQQRQAHELRVAGTTRLRAQDAHSSPVRRMRQPQAVHSATTNESSGRRATATHATESRPAAIQTAHTATSTPAPVSDTVRTAPTTTAALSSAVARPHTSMDSSIQTDALDGQDASVAQWVRLLSQRVELLAANYVHERPALSDTATRSSQQQERDSVASAWRVGHALLSQQQEQQQELAPLTMASLERLEQALAALTTAVDTSVQRARVRYEQSLATLQRTHHETLERVVAESVDELKAVRASHRSKLEQLERDVCAARAARDDWQQRAVEAEHRRALERETTESHAATFRDKFERLSVRFDEDIARITEQLETARRDRDDAQSRCDAATTQRLALEHALAQARDHASRLTTECEALKRELTHVQERSETTAHARAAQHDAVVDELTRAKQALETELASRTHQHTQDVATLTNRVEMLAADDYRSAIASEQLAALEQQHERELEALRAAFAEQVESQGRAVAQALVDVRDAAEQSAQHASRSDDAAAEIQALRRKCRALESLLDKKLFDDESVRSSSSSASGWSHSGVSTSPLAASGDHSRVAHKPEMPAMIATDCSDDAARLHERTRLAHRLKASPMDRAPSADDTFATDANTTMRNATWLNDDDSDSDSSGGVLDLDSILSATEARDHSTPQPLSRRARPHSASSGRSATPSNADILALVRKLETYTAQTASFGSSSSSSAASSGRSVQEPESEQHTLFRTPEARATTRKSAPPPVHRRRKQQQQSHSQLQTDATGATGRRPLHKPSTSLTSKPLRTSLVSASSASSVAATPMHHRGRTLAHVQAQVPFR